MLAPLSQREAGRLISALLDERLAADLRRPILERVGGNPLYAEEYARLLLDRGLLLRTNGRAAAEGRARTCPSRTPCRPS